MAFIKLCSERWPAMSWTQLKTPGNPVFKTSGRYICVLISVIKRASSGPPCWFGVARLVLSIHDKYEYSGDSTTSQHARGMFLQLSCDRFKLVLVDSTLFYCIQLVVKGFTFQL